MRLRRNDTRIFCSSGPDTDPDILRVAEQVYRRYDDRQARWALADGPQIWRICLGRRSAVVGVRQDGRLYAAKLFYDQRARTRLRVRLGLAKARRAYRNGLRLAERGIPCPRTLGYVEQRPGRLPLLVMELLADAAQLDHWIDRRGVTRPLVEAVARFVRHLHDQGIFHRDLSPRNLMVGPSGQTFRVWLVDYEDARFRRTVSPRRRLANLHHLHERLLCRVSLRDRLRFLRAYAGPGYRAWRDPLRGRIQTRRSRKVQAYHEYLRTR
ncbi:MAG: hypothetical protein KBE04_04845 [Phycisphaerae bacterium]|nr:hypothetical protein [Phycisphaerae bacterium]